MKKILWLLLFALFSCKSEEYIAMQITGFDDKPAANGDSFPLDSVKLIPLGSGDKILCSIQSVDVWDTIIAIHASNGLFAYNRNGRYLFQYGRKGNGAGEYISLQTAYYDEKKNTVNLIDGYRNRIMEYSLDGRFMEAHDNKKSKFSWFNRCVLLTDTKLFSSNMLFKDMTDIYSLYDTCDFSKEDLYRFLGETDGTGEYVGHHPFTVTKEGVAFIVPFENTVYEYMPSGKCRPMFAISTDKRILSDEELQSIKDFSIFRYGKELDKNHFIGFTDIFETERQYILNFNSLYYFLIEKDKMHGRVFSSPIYEDIEHMPLIHPISQYGKDTIIGYVTPQEVKNWKVSKSCQDKNLLKLARMCDGMSDTDSPILIFYKLL